MRGFILAAGFGTRLRPLTEHVPKALVQIGGKPLLDHVLEQVQNAGVSGIAVNSHYLHEQLEQHQSVSKIPYRIFHEKDKIRGTGGAFYFARDFLSADEIFCTYNVDIVAGVDLKELAFRFQRSGSIAALAAVPVDTGGTILYNTRTGTFLGVAQDRGQFPDAAGADYMAIALYRREFLDLLTPEDFSVVPVWKRTLEKGHTISVLFVPGQYWCDIGSAASLARAHFDILDGISPVTVRPGLMIDPVRKICIPEQVNLPDVSIGPYSWVQGGFCSGSGGIHHSVIFDNADVNLKENIDHVLLTQWGAIHFE